jgi:hypothetical protein
LVFFRSVIDDLDVDVVFLGFGLGFFTLGFFIRSASFNLQRKAAVVSLYKFCGA